MDASRLLMPDGEAMGWTLAGRRHLSRLPQLGTRFG